MEIEHLPLAGALLLTPATLRDDRGSFTELYVHDRYRGCGVDEVFVQDNLSVSRRGVLRGLHGDARMAKLVGVLCGSVFDAIVDVRPGSPTYGKWHATTLDGRGGRQVYIPQGFLHGFLALQDDTVVCYKQSAAYDPRTEIAVAWNDPDLGIAWPLRGAAPILSPRDARAGLLSSVTNGPAPR